MENVRLRTKLQLSLLLITSLLLCSTLLIVHQTIKTQVRREIFEDLHNSVSTFHNVMQQREIMQARSTALISELPSLKALMTTHDADTIQDASRAIWHLAGSDLFILTDREGKVVALHTSAPGFSRTTAEEQIRAHSAQDEIATWWYGGGHLYEVFLRPIYFGSAAEDRLLGVLAIGQEVDDRMAREVGRVATSEVRINYGDSVIVSTLRPSQEADLAANAGLLGNLSRLPAEIRLGGERFLVFSLDLDRSKPPSTRLTVLKSYDQAAAFLTQLNRLILGLGLAAVVFGSVLIYLICLNFTRPLENLAAGVKALEKGDFSFPLESHGDDEVAVVTNAFGTTRRSLKLTQQKLLQADRLATIGLMASSISHDLRHPLTAILANAEFLCEGRLNGAVREDLYDEIRSAVNRMIDLIDSLLEFSRGREALQLTKGRVDEIIMRAVQAIRTRPEFHGVKIDVVGHSSESWFDNRRLERALYNLLLNACEAVPENGNVEISVAEADGTLRVLVTDSGHGIAEAIREKLFQPFVSYGKENGTGLGLAIAQKIVGDHGGSLRVTSTSGQGTTFELVLPLNRSTLNLSAAHATSVSD
jgi:signal transduction histidine kinase